MHHGTFGMDPKKASGSETSQSAFWLLTEVPMWLVLRRADRDVAPVASLVQASRIEGSESIAYAAAA
jgi:hypothetical protein